MESLNREVTSKDEKSCLIDTVLKFNDFIKSANALKESFEDLKDCNEYIDTESSSFALPSSFDDWVNGSLKDWVNESKERILIELGTRVVGNNKIIN